jgi:alkylation response protein AidB-like acyl-CoA dehydrogenase
MIVHAFMPRATEGYSIKDTWDVLGMRATASHDTILEGAVVPDKYIARVVPAGFAGADLFVLADLPVGADRLRQRLLRPVSPPASI